MSSVCSLNNSIQIHDQLPLKLLTEILVGTCATLFHNSQAPRLMFNISISGGLD